MRVYNKSIVIRNGTHEKTFHNFILNNYIEMYNNSLLQDIDRTLEVAYIVFDREVLVNPDTTQIEYDLALPSYWKQSKEEDKQITSSQSVEVTYIYKNYEVENDLFPKVDWRKYAGRKIMGIGFGTGKVLGEIQAFLDTSAYHLILEESADFIITRVDRVENSAIFTGENISFPLHLSPNNVVDAKDQEHKYRSYLSKIGFGIIAQEIEKSYLPEEVVIQTIDNGKMQIQLPYETKSPGKGLYPQSGLYPSSTLYPQQEEGLYPNNDTFPGNTLYPQEVVYRYIIYEYRVQRLVGENFYEDTDKKYLQSYALSKYGKVNYSIQYVKKEY